MLLCAADRRLARSSCHRPPDRVAAFGICGWFGLTNRKIPMAGGFP